MRELRVEDALMYLDQVKMEFGDRPHIYNEFLDIMKTFKSQAIDTPGVIRRVASLFHGNKRLVLGFNTFLPEGYRIELPLDGSLWPVYREPGRTGVISIAPLEGVVTAAGGGGARPSPSLSSQPPRRGGPPPPLPPGAMAGRGGFAQGRMGAQGGGSPQGGGGGTAGKGMGRVGSLLGPSPPGPRPMVGDATAGQLPSLASTGSAKAAAAAAGGTADDDAQPIEFDHAINYVTTIKRRFASNPEIYRKFLEILHTYQKEQRGIKEVLDEVSLLFADHADLLKEFTYFLPDAVQAQAKAQLDVAAKKAEDRAKLRELAARNSQQSEDGYQQQGIVTTPGGRSHATLPPPPPSGSSVYSPSPPRAEPIVPSHIPRVPFGATKGRSKDREREISRGAVHGDVSFGAVRPPRRNELTPAQAAHFLGRPMTIPQAPLQPMTSESLFFEHVKQHFHRCDLFPDKPIMNRKQTPYTEFVKCLHLFGAGILNKDELIQLLRGLFIQGSTPKNSTNATYAGATHAAMALLSEIEKVLVGRGPFAMQELNKKMRSKYGGHPLRAYDLGETSVKITPSYRTYPSDYVFQKFSGSGGETENEVLNFECFCTAQDWSVEHSGEKYFKRLEEYDGIKARCNLHEEILARAEVEMHEVDMAIERNASVMRALEPVAEEATQLREQEENDEQPIGRLQYKLRSRALNSIHIGAIARIYGESGEEVLQHLLCNPLVVAPIVFNRLKEKNEEWRKVKTEMNKEWKKTIAEHIGGILDAKTFSYKREIEKVFSKDRLVEDCVKAKFFAKQPSKIKRHPSTNMILPDFHIFNPDSEHGLFQPHISVLVSKSMPHEQANSLLIAYFSRDAKYSSDLESFTKVWSEFISSWFELPSQESPVETNGVVSSTDTLTPGRRVRTSVGVGQIISLADHNKYLVKFSFGVGYVVRSAVNHVFDENDTDMDTSAEENTTDVTQLMTDDIQILFGTEKMYLFIRLYILLVTMLYQAKRIADCKGADTFTELVSVLNELLKGKMTPKAFEDNCIKTFVNDAYSFVAIPPLVEKFADASVKMVKEDCLESLYQCSQLKLKVSVETYFLLSVDIRFPFLKCALSTRSN